MWLLIFIKKTIPMVINILLPPHFLLFHRNIYKNYKVLEKSFNIWHIQNIMIYLDKIWIKKGFKLYDKEEEIRSVENFLSISGWKSHLFRIFIISEFMIIKLITNWSLLLYNLRKVSLLNISLHIFLSLNKSILFLSKQQKFPGIIIYV